MSPSSKNPQKTLILAPKTLGIAALIVTVLVWSGFFLSLRFGAKIKIPPTEIAILRFLPGTLVFLPVLIKNRRRIFSAPKMSLILMILGSGFPYLIVAGYGMTFVPVADGSTLLPGLNPVFVSLLGFFFLKRNLSKNRILGLSVIILGIIAMVLASINHPSGTLSKGLFILMSASLMWATFTLAFEKSGLSPIEGAAVITYGSIPLLLGTLLTQDQPLQLLQEDLSTILPIFVAQGLGVGLLSTIAYTTAIKYLGTLPASMVGALTPVVATLLGILWLAEVPVALNLIGMVLVIAGVVLANRYANPKH